MGNYHTKLRKAGYAVIAINTGIKCTPQMASKGLKRPKRNEVNYLPKLPEGQNKDGLEAERKLLVEEMKKQNPSGTVIASKDGSDLPTVETGDCGDLTSSENPEGALACPFSRKTKLVEFYEKHCQTVPNGNVIKAPLKTQHCRASTSGFATTLKLRSARVLTARLHQKVLNLEHECHLKDKELQDLMMNTQVFASVHSLNVLSPECLLVVMKFVATEIHHQFFGLPCIYLEAALLAPVHKVLDQSSVLPVNSIIIIRDQADDGRVIRELLQRNGVGVILKKDFSKSLVEVKRVSDRVMNVKLEVEGVMINVISAYASQVGCEMEEKEKFWSELDKVVESRKVLGVTSGNRNEDKETWWWNVEVQESIRRKRLAKQNWDRQSDEKSRQEYKEMRQQVKRHVAKAKEKAYEEL
ncbi:hypothetical protein C0J45_7133 [Silurus meridionalis]|nr:hypothetical protein C0J45_7133 [Silurus meridionalis]